MKIKLNAIFLSQNRCFFMNCMDQMNSFASNLGIFYDFHRSKHYQASYENLDFTFVRGSDS